MRVKRWWIVIIVLCFANLSPILAQDVPRFESADCPSGANLTGAFHCGYLIVRADRSQPDSPTTPPAYAELAASTLSSSQLIIMPDTGHGALATCGILMTKDFLRDPTAELKQTCPVDFPPQFQ
jgi:pimeloyl-ACP methyl ester carboxylesterase